MIKFVNNSRYQANSASLLSSCLMSCTDSIKEGYYLSVCEIANLLIIDRYNYVSSN